MKTFIIYMKGHSKSEIYAKKCLESCEDTFFKAELFEGTTPATLKNSPINSITHRKNSRALAHYEKSKTHYKIKKSCFSNHVRLWKKCCELNEPIVVLEHDSYFIRNPKLELNFKDYLILNYESAVRQSTLKHVYKKRGFPELKAGINPYNMHWPELKYRRDNDFYNGIIVPGTAAYAISPSGANKLLKKLPAGWEQSDFFVNTSNVNIEYIHSECFTFKFPNLRTSHGGSKK